MKAWVRANGGLSRDPRLEARARAAAGEVLLDAHPEIHVEIALLNRDDLTAFSWPDGRIFLSRRLVADLDEDLLRASLAHEIAHLLNHRDATARAATRRAAAPRPDDNVAALTSPAGLFDAEARADRRAVELLTESGTPPDAMHRLLRRVLCDERRVPHLPAAAQHELDRRVELLRASR